MSAAVSSVARSTARAVHPLDLRVGCLAAMANAELADHPVYDSVEVQRFDGAEHGSGLLVFLSRRADRRVDYYVEPGVRVDRDGYELGAGTGVWTETTFEAARLDVADDGVVVDVRFTDVDGRLVEIRADDRDGRPRRRGALLAPVGAAIEDPAGLLLVWMPRFDLVRAGGAPPVVRIDGCDAAIGRLAGRRLHRRHLVKYAADLVSVEVNRRHDGPLPEADAAAAGETLPAVAVDRGGHRARLFLNPPLPDLRALAHDEKASGRWHVVVDGTRLTGGTWTAWRRGEGAALDLLVDERWRPGPLPWLMRVVTTLLPLFRRWPTTYRWHADVHLGEPPVMTSRWVRTADAGGGAYRRATGS